MDNDMQKALEADGEKLRQLTGEDHGPFEEPADYFREFNICSQCGAELATTREAETNSLREVLRKLIEHPMIAAMAEDPEFYAVAELVEEARNLLPAETVK